MDHDGESVHKVCAQLTHPQTRSKTQPSPGSSAVDARVAGAWSEVETLLQGRQDREFRILLLQRSGASQML